MGDWHRIALTYSVFFIVTFAWSPNPPEHRVIYYRLYQEEAGVAVCISDNITGTMTSVDLTSMDLMNSRFFVVPVG